MSTAKNGPYHFEMWGAKVTSDVAFCFGYNDPGSNRSFLTVLADLYEKIERFDLRVDTVSIRRMSATEFEFKALPEGEFGHITRGSESRTTLQWPYRCCEGCDSLWDGVHHVHNDCDIGSVATVIGM